MVRLAKSRRICVTSSTNGQRLVDPAWAREIVASGLDSLILSADAVSPKSYAVSRCGGSLENLRAGLCHLRQARRAMGRKTPRLYLQFVITRQNEHERPMMAEAARSWGADHVLLKSLYLHDGMKAEAFLPADPRFRRYRSHAGRWVPKTGHRHPCARLAYSCVILWDGNIVPCCFDKNGEHRLENAAKPLETIFRSPVFQAFRRQQRSSKAPYICQNCSDGLTLYPT